MYIMALERERERKIYILEMFGPSGFLHFAIGDGKVVGRGPCKQSEGLRLHASRFSSFSR